MCAQRGRGPPYCNQWATIPIKGGSVEFRGLGLKNFRKGRFIRQWLLLELEGLVGAMPSVASIRPIL